MRSAEVSVLPIVGLCCDMDGMIVRPRPPGYHCLNRSSKKKKWIEERHHSNAEQVGGALVS